MVASSYEFGFSKPYLFSENNPLKIVLILIWSKDLHHILSIVKLESLLNSCLETIKIFTLLWFNLSSLMFVLL